MKGGQSKTKEKRERASASHILTHFVRYLYITGQNHHWTNSRNLYIQ